MFVRSSRNGTLRQGEILTGVVEPVPTPNEHSLGNHDKYKVDEEIHDFAMLLNQACDLEQDFKSRSEGDIAGPAILLNLLCYKVVTALELRGPPGKGLNSTIWDQVKINGHIRYQFISASPFDCDLAGEGLPELGLDFKRFFTITPHQLYSQINEGMCQRRTCLEGVYALHLSHRFAHYLSRVGLPEEYESLPVTG